MNAKTPRQWMVTHEWMVKPMAQTEWIEGKGLLVWVAEVFSALGSGLYLVSLFFMAAAPRSAFWGALLGWVMIAFFKLPLHFLYLGRPWRFWRSFPPFSNAWKTSWFARGIVFTMIFLGLGAVQLVLQYLLSYDVVVGSWSDPGWVYITDWMFMILAGMFCVLTGVYCGFAMSYCKSVPFWNTGLLPFVFLLMGIADGLALIMAVGLVVGETANVIGNAEAITRFLLIINALLIIFYLVNASYQSTTAELSVKELIRGHMAWVFWLGIVLLGIVVPFLIAIVGLFVEEVTALLVFAIVCHTIGAFSLKYGVLKVGIYRPLLPKAHAY
jgi:formate-dependent nitrite reductase membrane component NrfD